MRSRPGPPPSGAPPRGRLRPAAAVTGVLSVAVLVFAIAHIGYLRFVCDDAFISFRYAGNLAHGHGLVYNPGERVEGYSNFLWTLLMALVIGAGGRPEAWAPVLGGMFALATVALVGFAARRRGLDPLVATVLLAASSGFAAWATGGLETSLFTMCVTGGTIALALGLDSGPGRQGDRDGRLFLLSALAFGLAALTRPDGLLLAACAGAFLVALALRSGIPARHGLAWLALVAAFVVPHVAWRLAYYGHLLPNSFAVKTPGTARLAAGFAYLGGAAVELHLYLLAVPIVIAAIARRGVPGLGRRDIPLVAAIAVPYTLYLASTGGDFMPLYRFVAPLLPLAALAAAAALAAITGARNRGAARAASLALTVLLVAAYGLLNLDGSRRQQAVWAKGEITSVGWARVDTENWLRAGDLLRRVALPTDTLGTTAAGAVPYRSGLYTIDLLGLNAADLSRYRRRATDLPGHTLLLDERWLDAHPPQILLGHPMVRPTPEHVGASLDFAPDWRDRVLAHYQLVGLTLMGDPERYVGCLLRNDVADRIIETGLRVQRGLR